MHKTKVCILQNGFRHGGTDTFIINLCHTIDKTNFDIEIVNPCNTSDGNILEYRITELDIPIYHTSGFGTPKSKIKHLFQLYRFLKKGKFDTFHTNIDLFNGPQLLVAWLAGVKNRICHSHNTDQTTAMVESARYVIKLYQWLMKKMCVAFSTQVAGCSQEALTFLFGKNKWPTQKISPIVFNGIDIEKFQQPIDKEKKKKELGLKASRHILTVGRIFYQKNPEFLINVFSEFAKNKTDCDLVWVGIGEDMNDIKNIATEQGIIDRVHFLGARDDVDDIMKVCDMFLLTSRFEGLGIVLIEAQAAGLPCVASTNVPKLADCGSVKFMSLDLPIKHWCNVITDSLNSTNIKIDNSKLNNFSLQTMASQMQQLYSA